MSLPKLPTDSFCWQRWRQCDVLLLFGCGCRTYDLVKSAHIIRKYAVGYTDGESLGCRPKNNHKAVMFLKDDTFSWFHLRNNEFEIIFQNGIDKTEKIIINSNEKTNSM